MTDPLWTPSSGRVAASNLRRFQRFVTEQREGLGTFADVHDWSVDHPAEFWAAVWDF